MAQKILDGIFSRLRQAEDALTSAICVHQREHYTRSLDLKKDAHQYLISAIAELEGLYGEYCHDEQPSPMNAGSYIVTAQSEERFRDEDMNDWSWKPEL